MTPRPSPSSVEPAATTRSCAASSSPSIKQNAKSKSAVRPIPRIVSSISIGIGRHGLGMIRSRYVVGATVLKQKMKNANVTILGFTR